MYSESCHSPNFYALGERAKQEPAGIRVDKEGISDSFEEIFLYVVEENSTGGDDDNEGSRILDKDNNVQNRWGFNPADSFVRKRSFIPFIPTRSNAAPLYLLNRVFRI